MTALSLTIPDIRSERCPTAKLKCPCGSRLCRYGGPLTQRQNERSEVKAEGGGSAPADRPLVLKGRRYSPLIGERSESLSGEARRALPGEGVLTPLVACGNVANMVYYITYIEIRP